jgi:hypothetical protein
MEQARELGVEQPIPRKCGGDEVPFELMACTVLNAHGDER